MSLPWTGIILHWTPLSDSKAAARSLELSRLLEQGNKGTSSKLKGYSAFEITDGCIADSTPGSEDGQVCHGDVCRGSSSASVGTDAIAGGFEVIFAASTDYTQYEWEVACPSLLDTMIINREECSCGEADCSVFIDGKDDVGLGGVTYFPENKYRAKIELVANGSCGGPTATVSMTIRCGESINILNPGFEEETTTGILDDWNNFVDGYKISTAEKFSGAKSLEVDLTPVSNSAGGVFQSVTRSFPLGSTFYSYGFSKAVGVNTAINAGNYAVFIDYRTDPGNNCANQPPTWDGCGVQPGTQNYEESILINIQRLVLMKVNSLILDYEGQASSCLVCHLFHSS